MDNNAPAVWKDYVSAPRWINIVSVLRRAALNWDVDFQVTAEDKGLLRTTIFFTVEGPFDQVVDYRNAMMQMTNGSDD